MKVSRFIQAIAIGVGLTMPVSGVAFASEHANPDQDMIVSSAVTDDNISSSGEELYRYVGDSVAAENADQPTVATSAARFIGRVDAHNAHKSGTEVSGHVSWTLVSGASRKMQVKSTLKAKTGWFGYSTKAPSGKVSVWPGGGRGKAAVARYQCKGAKSTKWYTYGEGFAPGTKKPWGYHKGNVVKIRCGA